ncbi:MAG TPA: DUF951 domain-containing protein [Candidatus Limnocylindrales bacterium]|nr:DUF951 domain-containing protein [Candidatus Limnocylindrales bacterium]
MPAGEPVVELHIGDRVTLGKRHPCGSQGWRVTRVGADIGLRCEGCGRRVMLERREVERRLVGAIDPASVDSEATDG